MNYFELLLLGMVIICGVSTCLIDNLMASLIIYMAYSVIMSIIWALLKAPDLAITEAAVGAGISSILLFMTLRKLSELRRKDKDEGKEA